ncbi:MAG: hypothetical protein H7Z40_22145 [Phycisphaerae bacterium]|nr:hypothetical protein [Gemmatimonadaceae bacterium]
MPSKPGRVPPPTTPEDPTVLREANARASQHRQLRRAMNAFAKCAMRVQEALPGTIGRRAAEARAAEAREALEATVTRLLKRERLSALARAHGSAGSTADDVLKYAQLGPEAYAVAAPIVQQIVRSHANMQRMMAEQVAAIDEQVSPMGKLRS